MVSTSDCCTTRTSPSTTSINWYLGQRQTAWIVFDHRQAEIVAPLTRYLLSDRRLDLEQQLGDLKLAKVANELRSNAIPTPWIRLTPVVSTNSAITNIQFVPGQATMILALKQGTLRWHSLEPGRDGGVVLQIPPPSDQAGGIYLAGESGLIGVALHPSFAQNRKLYVHYTFKLADGNREARTSEWTIEMSDPRSLTAHHERILHRIPQVRDNHNAGQLAFGPDGYLYIAGGDGQEGTPWRMSFAPDGRLLIGEDRREEMTFARAGQHHGWPYLKGTHELTSGPATRSSLSRRCSNSGATWACR